MKTLEHIASELAGYDPQALSADMVNQFLAKLVQAVPEVENVGIFAALGRVLCHPTTTRPWTVTPLTAHNSRLMPT